MGLDMYLDKNTYIFDSGSSLKITDDNGLINSDRVKYIIEEMCYWHKANAIHNWFVENVQGGDDNCGEYYVSVVKLKELLNLVLKVLDNHNQAQQLLPTRSGFFFGSNEYDKYYFTKLERTRKALEIAINENGDYYYHSSW